MHTIEYICVTCGVQYGPTNAPPLHCLICEDERQWVNHAGQQWISLAELSYSHKNIITELEPNLIEIKTDPLFAIGQHAMLIKTESGNILWDCISLIDDVTVEAIQSSGGISTIAISHPHFYSSMVEWSRAFNHAPIFLHSADRSFVMNPDPAIVYWEGDVYSLSKGITLVRCGGHFPGSTILHWASGAGGRGVLLSGDTINVMPDTRYVSFMYSYPNYIPLSAQKVRQILKAIEAFQYDRIYSGWSNVCHWNAKKSVTVSADRYIAHLLD